MKEWKSRYFFLLTEVISADGCLSQLLNYRRPEHHSNSLLVWVKTWVFEWRSCY